MFLFPFYVKQRGVPVKAPLRKVIAQKKLPNNSCSSCIKLSNILEKLFEIVVGLN
jgi:hypothetical protein